MTTSNLRGFWMLGAMALVACSGAASDAPGGEATPGPQEPAAGGDASTSNPPAQNAEGGAGALPDAGPAAATMTFASQATCSTMPCEAGTPPSGAAIKFYDPAPAACETGPVATNVISLGMVNNGAANECRIYGYYRPKNLVGKATAVFTAGGSGAACGSPNVGFDGANWLRLADENRLVVIFLNYCPRNAWVHPAMDVPAPPSGSPSDGPYLDAVVKSASADPNINIDASRLILTGGSSGGTLTWGTACDPTYSTLFKGYAPVSAAMNVAVDGANNPVPGTERCTSADKKFFLTNVHGTADGAVAFAGKCLPGSHCITSFAETEAFWSKYLGCKAGPTRTMFGTPQAANIEDSYGNCGFGSPANQYQSLAVTGGGHQWPNLDAARGMPTNGFDTAKQTWDFFSTRTW